MCYYLHSQLLTEDRILRVIDEGIVATDWPSFPWLMGRYISVHLSPLSTSTDCPGAHDALIQVWEEIPQDTVPRLIRSPDVVRRSYRHVGAIHTDESHSELPLQKPRELVSLSLTFLIVGVILNPALSGLMILVSTDHCYVILFSTNHTMYISKDVQLEWFVYQDLI